MSSDDEYPLTKESLYDDSLSVVSESVPPRRGKSPAGRTTNTGPKGVRADARAYEASKRDRTVMNKLKNMLNKSTPASSGNESSSDADEDKWMSRWREQRMKELSKTGVAGVNLFGQVDDVDARGYLAAVDYEDSDTPEEPPVAAKRLRAQRHVVSVVLIHNAHDDSKTLFQIFSNLARRHPTIHFLRLPASEAEDMSSSSLPAILAYRRGELIANLVSFVDELAPGQAITITTVEAVLTKSISAE